MRMVTSTSHYFGDIKEFYKLDNQLDTGSIGRKAPRPELVWAKT